MGGVESATVRDFLAALPLARPTVRLGRRLLKSWRRLQGSRRTEQQLDDAWVWYDQLWRSPPEGELLSGAISAQAVPVIMCLWGRPHRIDAILKMLDAQAGVVGVRLMLWCNNPQDYFYYQQRVRAHAAQGALQSVEMIKSPHNVRGVGRFVVMRRLLNEGRQGPVVMLDDDQDISADFLAELLAQYRPRSVIGCWAWQAASDNYWQRSRPAPGDAANYVGTGGCVCDSALVANDEFFTKLPRSGLFLEDVWMSRYALSCGWSVERAHAQVSFDHAEDNQYHDLTEHKIMFWRALQQVCPLPSSHRRAVTRT